MQPVRATAEPNEETSTPRPRTQSGSLATWAVAVAATFAVAPIIIHAVQSGLAGWTPASDAAATVVRSRHALGLHPTWVGMFTDASSWTGNTTYFPGPWQLYWLAIPTRLLGITWGPLLAMAALNSFWTLLGGWFAARRSGPWGAVLALLFLAVLQWSLGGTVYLSPVPMVMIGPAFATFLFGVWAIADGDFGALPMMTLVGMFLLLDHLVLATLVPVLGLAGLTGLAGVLWRERRRDPTWGRRCRRKLARAVGASIAIVMAGFVPALVDEARRHPGNLRNLLRAFGARPDNGSTLEPAWKNLTALLVHPPFWLRPSRTQSPISSRTQMIDPTLAVIYSVVIVVLLGGATWLAVRRRDRTSVAALAIAAIGFVASVANMGRSPSKFGIIGQYYLSAWPIAMFFWFAVALALLRAIPTRQLPRARVGLLGLTIVVALLNVPLVNIDGGTTKTSDSDIAMSRSLTEQAMPHLRDSGPIQVALSSPSGYFEATALALALDDEGIPYCTVHIPQLLAPEVDPCSRVRWTHAVTVRNQRDGPPSAGGEVIAHATAMTEQDRRELAALTSELRAATRAARSEHRPMTVDPTFAALAEQKRAVMPSLAALVDTTELNSGEDPMSSAEGRAHFADIITKGSYQQANGRTVVPVRVPGFEPKALLRWATLEQKRTHEVYDVYLTPRP